jgi:3-deoxy-manno-octulosonate cytidylyltransferase (CMP-KDO synthetase)
MGHRIVAVIPARMGSSRFPGKPLAMLLGRPMIEHVIRRAEMCDELDAVYVATCDDEIRRVVEALNCPVIMTSPAHERATDRVAEAAEQVKGDMVVMIQGDEPMITAGMVTAAINPMLEDQSISCVNLIRRLTSQQEYLDLNTIKVVMNTNQDAIYFSRTPIAHIDNVAHPEAPIFRQVCVIPFRRKFLFEFARLPPTPLEQAEAIDMLRIIENGGRIRLVQTIVETYSVDTPGDLRLVERIMKDDPLIRDYPRLAAQAEVL